MKKFFRTEQLLAGVIVLLAGIVPAWGIVLHPNGEPNLTTWTNRPDPNVVGAWSSNASFMVIAPNWVATTRHQGTNPATITIAGIAYNCTYRTEWTGGPPGNADIRLIRLTTSDGKGANLAHYANPYTNLTETGRNIVIGGYGKGRGASLITQGTVYGYQWDGSGNTTQRWCQNIIDDTGINNDTIHGYISDVIIAHFDDLGYGNSQPYEGMVAGYDSGGGWFIYDSSEWKVAGLSHGVEHGNESWFRDSVNPATLAPDVMDAVRISSYASWILGIIHTQGDLTGDDWVDFSDFAILSRNWQRSNCTAQNNWCEGADFAPHNGHVDWNDLGFLADNWLTGWAF